MSNLTDAYPLAPVYMGFIYFLISNLLIFINMAIAAAKTTAIIPITAYIL